jgi:N-acetyl-gamma-glutamyl-phosphate reductase
MRQTLSRVAGADVPLVFTPHLLPLKRGILSTAVARLNAGVSPARVTQALTERYGHEPLVTVLGSADAVRLADVVHTPQCLIGASADATHVVVVCAIDNLLKGAASQAVQNMNVMLGLEETEGLSAGHLAGGRT